MSMKKITFTISTALILSACQQQGSAPSEAPKTIDHLAIAMALAPTIDYAIPGDIEQNCYFNGQVVINNSSVTAFQSSSVPFGQSCVSEQRTCSSGLLSGSYNFASCQVEAAASCLFNGQTLQSGESVTAYVNSSVSSGDSCVSEVRTCSNGVLSGSAQYSSCSADTNASCLFNGATVEHGQSVPAFLSSTAAYGQECQLEYRTCDNGLLSGSNTFATCEVAAPASCLFDGKTLAHGESVTAFINSSVASGNSCDSEIRTCNNGTLSGSAVYSSCSVDQPASCLFNGQTIAHGQVVTAYSSSSVAYGEMCSAESRVCDNGHLSGTFEFASCDAGQPSACLFNGETIPHGASITAFAASSVDSGLNCSSEVRTCDNGVLSGSNQFASCEVNAPKSCLFNGVTVADGQTIKAYKESSPSQGNLCESEDRTCSNGVLSGSYGFASCQSQTYEENEDDEDMIKICKHVVEIKHKEKYSRHPNNGLHLGWYKYKERFNCGKHLGWYKHKNKNKHPQCSDKDKWYKEKRKK